MTRGADSLRYIDIFLESFERGDADSVAAFGTHVHWGYWETPSRADGSTADFARAAENMSRRITEAACIGDGQSVLDVGCGFGGTIASMNSRFAGMKLAGVNIDGRQVARARATVHARAENSIAFIQADAMAMPQELRDFDAVLAIESVCHFRSREVFFRQAGRILKPGGRLVVVDFVPTGVLKPWIVFTDLLFGKVNEKFYGPMNLQCTRSDYRKMASRCGFQVEREDDVTGNTLPSYPFTRRLMSGFKRSRIETMTNNSINRNMEWLSRLGLLGYLILTFLKEGAAVA